MKSVHWLVIAYLCGGVEPTLVSKIHYFPEKANIKPTQPIIGQVEQV
jgi:hypothetical protein